jgi:hypothetical protein
MTQFLYGLVKDLQNKVQILFELLSRAKIHQDLASDYALQVQHKLTRIQTALRSMAADNNLLNPAWLVNNFQKYRRLSREVQLLEAFPLPVILRYTESDHYFYKLSRWLYKQIAYPLPPPVISTISNEYYWAYPKYRLIVVPIGEEFVLLGLSDFYHELAHFLYAEYRPHLIGEFMNDLDKYIEIEKQRARGERGKKRYLTIFEKIKSQWKENWVVEFICDMIATYLVGPAYGWANLKLTANSLARFDVFGPAVDEFPAVEHPSDEARMRGIYEVLTQLKFETEIKRIDEKWQQYVALSGSKQPTDYVYFYPNNLLNALARFVFEGCKNIGLVSFNEQLRSTEMNLAVILNAAWNKFLKEPEHYPDWERSQLQEIRAMLFAS